MFDPPKTKAEAEKYRYGTWRGRPNGYAYKEDCCAYSIPYGGRSVLFKQCTRKNGNGPDGLYCKQHAKRFQPPHGESK